MNALTKPPVGRDHRTTVMYGTLVLVLIVVALQLWLLAATMNAWLDDDDSILWPAAAVSAAGFLLNVGLLAYLARLDSRRLETNHQETTGGSAI